MKNNQNRPTVGTHGISPFGQRFGRASIKLAWIVIALPIATGLLAGCDPVTDIFVENKTGTTVEVRLETRNGNPEPWIKVPNGAKIVVGSAFHPGHSGEVLHYRANGRDWREVVSVRQRQGSYSNVFPVKLPFSPKLSVPNL